MADKTYIVNQESPENITGFENFNSQDVSLINSFEVNTLFNPDKNFMELHVISLIDELLESDYNYVNYKQFGNAQSAGNSGASILTLDPVSDVKRYGYENGSVKLLYHFLNDLFSETKTPVEFFIDSISEDRTELRLQTLQLTADKVVQRTNEIRSKLQDQSYFSEFRLDFKNNDLYIGLNIDTVDLGFDKAVVVKLYEPLPVSYAEKSKLTIVEIIADSVAYEVDYEVTEDEPVKFPLKPANFNLEITDDHIVPTGYFNYDELFAYPVNNSNSEIYSMISQKGIELSIDHTDYSNFVHFSSAQERLLNFKYKLDLISSSYASIDILNSATTGISGVSGSQTYHKGIVEGIINNFDHYERFLYYESGSSSWPKVNSVKPYVNQSSLTLEATNWFSNQLTTAVSYDLSNYNSVLSAIPSYIKDDTSNEAYLTFLFMIGQHFDLLWIYAKAVSDKYNADNRLDYGIPKDLVSEALKNFGVKLYTSNKSIEDLFTTITGQSYQSGSETITSYITGSLTGSNTPIQPVSYDGYTKEVQKRIYHNLPFLLKTKGTERGIRALINCFGIPSDTLQLKLYGGQNTLDLPFYGDFRHYTSSLDKIRLDNTGSIISGSTLSQYVSTVKQDSKYTDDVHIVEVGFSPTNNVDNYIISKSLSTFNIDEYLGDPRSLYSTEYAMLNSSGSSVQTLIQLTNQVMSGSSAYEVFDYVRLIKFFDNTIFKMVKDFIPARSVADTGIIIKPHILHRSKAKSPIVTGSQPEYTASIDIAFIRSTNGNTFGSNDIYDTSYNDVVQTPDGVGIRFPHAQQQPKYNGEFSGSNITITQGNLNVGNIYTDIGASQYNYTINFVSESNEICILDLKPGIATPFYVTSSTQQFSPTDFFINTNASSVYSASSPSNLTTLVPVTFPITFNQYTQTTPGTIPVTLKVTNTNYTLGDCSDTVSILYGTCSLGLTQAGQDVTTVVTSVPTLPAVHTPISTWFNISPLNTVTYTLTWNGNTYTLPYSTGITSYTFPDAQFPAGTEVTVTANDPNLGGYCQISKTVYVAGQCTIGLISTGSTTGLEFNYSSNMLAVKSTYLDDTGFEVPNDWQNDIDSGFEGTVDINSSVPRYSSISATGVRKISTYQFGTPTDPQGKQLTQAYNFLGVVEGAATPVSSQRAKGLQGYFAPPFLISPSGYQMPNDDTYYNVYALKNTSRTGYYNLTTQLGSNRTAVNQHTYSNQRDNYYFSTGFNPDEPVFSILSDTDYYLWWKFRRRPPYAPTSTFPSSFPGNGYSYGNIPLPVGIVTPFKNFINNDMLNPSVVSYTDATVIVRALVVEAYKQSQPSCRQSITIYGKKADIASMNSSIEGTGTVVHFTERWIALDWDYTTVTPGEEPGLLLPGGDLYDLNTTSPGTRYYHHTPSGRTYYKVPIRTFTTT